MIKLDEIKFDVTEREAGTLIEAHICTGASVLLLKEMLQRAEEADGFSKAELVAHSKEALTNSILRQLYGEMREMFYELLYIAKDLEGVTNDVRNAPSTTRAKEDRRIFEIEQKLKGHLS